MITVNEHVTQFTKQTANLILNLNKEINIENSLSIIDNVMWSLKSMIAENGDLDQDTKKQYNELFSIMMNRFERVVNTIETDLNDILKHVS